MYNILVPPYRSPVRRFGTEAIGFAMPHGRGRTKTRRGRRSATVHADPAASCQWKPAGRVLSKLSNLNAFRGSAMLCLSCTELVKKDARGASAPK